VAPAQHVVSAVTPIAVVTTVASRAEAQAMAHALVERRLAACAQISDIESVYRWQGEVQQGTECRIVFKTTRERYAQVEQMIRQLHSYELPAIHALAFDAVHAPYAAWIAQSCDETSGQTTPFDGAPR
jgi:periplasmic divalent cation tolerance protein